MSAGGCAKVLDAFANCCDLLALKVKRVSIGWSGMKLEIRGEVTGVFT
jgi:hypothetical protein